MWKTLAPRGLSLKKDGTCGRTRAVRPSHSNVMPDRPNRMRYIGQLPFGHWHTTPFVCALRSSGLVAPLVLDGRPITGSTFRIGVQQILVPMLQLTDVVMMVHLGATKRQAWLKRWKRSPPTRCLCRYTAQTSSF